jgi:DNA-binding NarL/FixJ family response regulator
MRWQPERSAGSPALAGKAGAGEGKIKKVLVVDGSIAFAEVLACRLDTESEIHAFAATTIAQAQWVLDQHEVDILLLSVELDAGEALALARYALATHPAMHVVAISAREGEAHVLEAVRAGVSGWVSKSGSVDHLLAVIHGTLAGETWIPPRLLTGVLADLRSEFHEVAGQTRLLDTLTMREEEVLRGLMLGMTKDEIAAKLYLSRNTVRTHIQSALKKLHVHSVLAAVALARRAWESTPDASSDAGPAA